MIHKMLGLAKLSIVIVVFSCSNKDEKSYETDVHYTSIPATGETIIHRDMSGGIVYIDSNNIKDTNFKIPDDYTPLLSSD